MRILAIVVGLLVCLTGTAVAAPAPSPSSLPAEGGPSRSPLPADGERVGGFAARLGGDKVMGTVSAVAPNAVTVQTADGVVEVPFERANFRLAGKRVKPVELTPGAAVEIDYKGMTGTVTGRNGNLISFVPNKAGAPLMLPLSFVHKAKVYVYTAKGDIVRVPVDQAIAMEATAGTTVLGWQVPEGYATYPGPYGGSVWFGSPGYGWGPGWGWGPGPGWGWGWGVRIGPGWHR